MTYIVDISADAVADAEIFTLNCFVTAHIGFGTTEINRNVAVFNAFYNAVDDFADAVAELFKLAVAFGAAHFLNDNLLCSLCGNTAKIERRQLVNKNVTDLNVRFYTLGVIEQNLMAFLDFLVNRLDNHAVTGKVYIAGSAVN